MSWIWRVVAALLLVVAGVNAFTDRRSSVQPRSETTRRLASVFPASAAPHVSETEDAAYRVLVRGCTRPLTVAIVPPSFTPRAALLNLAAPGDHTYYAYTDWFGSRPDRLAVFRRRLSQPLLASLGQDRYSRLREMLVVAEPADCNIASTAQWANYWRSDVQRRHGRGGASRARSFEVSVGSATSDGGGP